MSVRIGVAGLAHETNTYVPSPTVESDFEITRGDEIVHRFGGTATAVGGLLAGAPTPVPLFHATAPPSGPIEHATYERLRDELLASVSRADGLDALALDLHGAAVAEGVDDVEEDLCRRLREVAPNTPLVATFDLHGNLTQAMANHLSLALGCREYPHTDLAERAVTLVDLTKRIIEQGLASRVHVEPVPLLLGAGPATTTAVDGAATSLNDACRELARRPGILDCTFFHGFAQSDVPFAGAAIVATDDGERGDAPAAARAAARQLWELRHSFSAELLAPTDAVRRALAEPAAPVVINEVSDNPGGGAPGNGTDLLRALLAEGVANACFGVLHDPVSVGAAAAAGPGTRIRLSLGGSLDVDADVIGIGSGRFRFETMYRGLAGDFGRTARLRVDGVDIVIGSRRRQVIGPEIFAANGIDVCAYRLVCVKSAAHFRAGFGPIAAAIVAANGPGLSSADVRDFPRAHAARRLYPLDTDTTYEPAA